MDPSHSIPWDDILFLAFSIAFPESCPGSLTIIIPNYCHAPVSFPSSLRPKSQDPLVGPLSYTSNFPPLAFPLSHSSILPGEIYPPSIIGSGNTSLYGFPLTDVHKQPSIG